MSNYVTTLKVDDGDYLAKIQKAREELNKTTQAARQANEQTRQETANRQALVRVTEDQRRETDKLKDAQDKQAKAAKDNSPWKDALREIPMVGRAMSFLEGPIGQLAAKYRGLSIAIGAAAGAALLLRSEAGKATKREDTALTTGLSVGRVQALSSAASSVGAEPSQIFQSIGDVRKNQGAALSGQQEQIKSFQQLGISIEQLRRLGPDELFLKIGQRLASGSGSAEDFNAAIKVMGEGSKTLIPAFTRDLAGLTAQFEKLGLVADENTNKVLSQTDKLLNTAKAGIGGAVNRMLSELAADFGSKSLAVLGSVMSATGMKAGDEILLSIYERAARSNSAQLGSEGEQNANRSLSARRANEAEMAQTLQAIHDQEMRDLEEINALLEQRARYEWEGLDAVQQRAELQSRIAAAQSTLQALGEYSGGNEKQKLQAENEILAAQLGLKQLDDAGKAGKGSVDNRRDTDALARIGGFRGGSERVESETRQLRQSLDRHAAASRQMIDELTTAVRSLT